MDAKSLAAQLNGEYPLRIPKDLSAAAKAAGLVIVYGASDDLMEFDGAIHDEFSVYEGGEVHLDAKGTLPDFQALFDGTYRADQAKGRLREYFQREPDAQKITAIWDRDGVSWQYKTAIPHETFALVEDGEVYCRGIVFRLADVVAPAT